MWLIDQLVEAPIQEAEARGEFDNPPGAGRPQVLDDDALVPEALRAGYRMLKNAGYPPPAATAVCPYGVISCFSEGGKFRPR